MALDEALLIAAPMLQDFLIGKDGLPLANGTITCYRDNSRTTLKNWYYQTGAVAPYSYPALPNPLTLSASGTIVDNNGNDTIPFFYPYSTIDGVSEPEPYYIVVKDSTQELQFTRANFPYIPKESPIGQNLSNIENYIVNNRFWRNIGSANVGALPLTATGINYIESGDFGVAYNTPVTSHYYVKLAPSQNDGFSMPDLNYIKDSQGGTESISFLKFPSTTTNNTDLTGDVMPEYYVNHLCVAQDPSVSLKVHQFPIALHILNLIGQTFTFTIQGMTTNDLNASIKIYLYQFAGTGISSMAPILIDQFDFTENWNKFTTTFTFPGNEGLPEATTSDDAWYIQIGMPTSGAFEINYTLPSLYLSDIADIPSDSFQSYDQIDTIISKPRTGDIRTSINKTYFYGWVPMSDGTIGYQSDSGAAQKPTARNNQDTWPLYNLIWTLFAPYSTGSSTSGVNLIAPMYTTGASKNQVGYGPNVTAPTTSLQDWLAGKQLSLTKSMGQVLLGTVPLTALIIPYTTTFTCANFAGLLILNMANNITVFNGMPIYFVGNNLPALIHQNVIYYVGTFNATQITVSTSFANAMAANGNASGNVLTFTTGDDSKVGTFVSSPAGTYEGEYRHMQLAGEIGAHQHPPLSPSAFFQGQGTGGTYNTTTQSGSLSPEAAFTGINTPNNIPFNVTQPGTFTNIYIKL